MPVARLVAPQEGWSQQSNRAPGIFFDQHKSERCPDGRPWWCWTETPADPTHPRGIVGELIPITTTLTIGNETIPGWSAPWVPEQKYVVRGLGMLAGNRFKIDYATMVSDYRQANERYYRLAATTAGAKNWPAPKLYGPVEFQLRAIVGDPPKSPKLPEAAMAGDPWLLGQTKHVNEALKDILDRETGRFTLVEDAPNAPVGAAVNPMAGLTDDQLEALAEMLAARKKTAKKTPPSSQAA